MQKAGIATARYHMVDDFDACKAFISEVGYPVIVKPDNGVGASHTYKLSSDDDLRHFLIVKEPEVVLHHGGVHPRRSQQLRRHHQLQGRAACSRRATSRPVSIMDIVNNDDNSVYYIVKDLATMMSARCGPRARSKSFGVKQPLRASSSSSA